MKTPTPIAVIALGALLLGACVDAEVHAVDADAREQLATTSTIVEDIERPLAIGAAAATARGNTVAVVDAAADDETDEVHALVEACAAVDAEEDVGVSLSFFALQLEDGSTETPIEPAEARAPSLRTNQLPPGSCTVGWLSFDLGDHDEPRPGFLIFGSRSSATLWDLTGAR